MLTACSKKTLLTYNPEPDAELYAINNKEQVSLVFFTVENADELADHVAVYKRFAEAFKDTEEVLVLNINKNNVIEFKNYGYYYFHNKGPKPKCGMILSNGVDNPIIETNPQKYIKTYEVYFKVPFNDKVYYGQKRKTEIAERQKKSEQTLKSKFKVDQNYATQFIKHSNSSFYPKSSQNLNCLNGKVTIKTFLDSAKTKKGAVQIETLYDRNGLMKCYSTFINGELFSEDIYYRNAYNLLDSIVKIDNKGSRSKSVFKYEKHRYSIITVDERTKMHSNIFYLNNQFQCFKKETLNDNGDVLTVALLTYDNWGRIIEETTESQKIKYEYNQQEDFYSSMKLYSTKSGALLTENTRKEEKCMVVYISKNNEKLLSKTISLNNSNGCTQTVYNYNGDNKISEVYEYFYEN
ncbi:hypothetical protein [Solitalea lacus]|uniref:hypothetical protein n=1 Tax=Solitalea lacus TaxID=2911172 RepID=UPI001EDA212C|nr:hypothetical protein [Solitalea lacus]UKJ08597.1 hypothetical protein L2B55_05380 [Solitalea lacus]